MGSAGVETNADVDRAFERLRDCSGRSHSSFRRAEGEEERVALCIDLDPALARTSFADHPAVFGKRVGVDLRAERVQQHRRTFDVGEEKRDGAGWEVATHRAPY